MKEATALASLVGASSVLVLGKGPSLQTEAFAEAAPGRRVVGINQTAASFPVDVAFFIDIEPFDEVADALLAGTCAVILPWRPNERTWRRGRSRPMSTTLVELLESNRSLRELDSQNRLFYFHTKAPAAGAEHSTFPPNLVSLSSLLQLLAQIGVSEVKTLGIDGGHGYSTELRTSSLGTQLRTGYSKQFPILRKIALAKGLTMERANEQTLNIYVGCEPAQHLAARVLEHSILRHTSHPVRVKRLDEHVPAERCSAQGRTPFSMQRFFIPELNQHQGLAVYLDSDMLVFGDIRELLDLRDPAATVCSAAAPPGSGRRPQFSVMVIDCARANWKTEEILGMAEETYEAAMFRFEFEPSKAACLPYQWNSLERYDADTRLVHFTDMERQPWLATDNHITPVWMDALFQALQDKFVSFDDLVQDVQRGWIRPGVVWQAEQGERDPSKVPRYVRLKDSMYTPPHTVARFTRRNTPSTRASLAVAKRLVHWARGQRNA